MADCSYFRCVQERRFVKRELQRWYKNMVYIVGLERVAEELMGRRKWKQYQESLAQSHADLLTKQSPSIEQQETSNKHQQQQNSENNKTGIKTETLDIKEENKLMTTEDVSEKLDNKTEIKAEDKENHEKEEEIESKEQNKIQIKSESLLTEVGDLKSDKVRPEPVDWKPQDKCYFCVDGKLLKVNEIGELVVETGPVQPEAELNKHIIESEDSSSSSDTNQKNNNYTSNQQSQYTSPLVQKNLEALLKTIGLNPNMTSLESVAAQLAAFQRLQTPELNHLSQLNPFYQNLFYQFPQVSPTTTPDRTSSPSVKTPTSVEIPSPSPTHQSGDVPLDLSAKPSGSSSTPTTPIDSRNIFRAKPRISTIPGRRTYTEEELNNALQDILSGKLGTRRAAQTYGIPRSTLRNKVYKLAIEQKRELLANHPPIAVLEDEDDKDSGGEDEKDSVLKLGNSNEQLQNYFKMLAKSSETIKPEQKETASNNNSMGGPSSWPIDPAAWIQGLMIANGLQGLQGLQGLAGFPGLLQQSASSASASSASPKEELPEFLRKLLTQPQDMKQDDKMDGRGGGSNGIDPLIMMNLLQQQQNKHKSRSSNTPEMDMNDGSDDSSTILKIPSIPKTIFNSGVPSSASSTQSKNGDITPSTSPQISGLSISPQLHVGGSTGQQTPTLANRLAIPSPSLMRQRSESESSQPTAKFNLHDVIRESISKNFQTNLLDDHKHSMPPLTIDTMDAYQKRPTISVIRNLGGTDISKFGTNPNITQLQQQQLSPNTGTGGKGTRPKRGKYRNYDRDSLVEAVKAVQRGEMSVHRAGSYYGVPHSTLEYKVKERHLMRPRKREPKPQPLDSSTSSSSTTSAIKRQEINAIDKSKALPNAKPPLKPPYGTNPNGMKIPPFIDHASMAAQLQLQSQLLWPHPSAFPGLSALDFARSTSQNNSSPFPQNTENFFAQQMLQKFQEEQQQQQQQQQQFKSPVNGNQNSNNGNKPSVRDLESLYNPVSTNGSFLDGIIRSTLDKKPNELTHSTLFEHLLKKSSMPNSGPSDDDDSYSSKVSNNKRPGSPLNYAHHDIKRERTSPSPNDNDVDSDYAMHEHQQQTSKLHDNLTIKEELNGSINNSDDVNS